MQEAIARRTGEQLQKEVEAMAALKAELSKEQVLVKSLRDKLSKVCHPHHPLLSCIAANCELWLCLADCMADPTCTLCYRLAAESGIHSSWATLYSDARRGLLQ